MLQVQNFFKFILCTTSSDLRTCSSQTLPSSPVALFCPPCDSEVEVMFYLHTDVRRKFSPKLFEKMWKLRTDSDTELIFTI